jgi:RNA polymerase sigma-70 factor (ECF subfamily)
MTATPELDRPTAATQEDFAALIAAVAAGDPEARLELVTCYEKEIAMTSRALLGRHLRSQSDAADLVQTVHRRLLEGIRDRRFNPTDRGDLLVLVKGLLRGRAAYLGRVTRRRADLLAQALADGTLQPPGDSLARPFDHLFVEDLEGLIGEVDSIDRQIVTLRFANYSDLEISQKVGQSYANVRTRLTRLRRRLAPHYQGLAPMVAAADAGPAADAGTTSVG